jgi:serine protease Do
MTVWKSGALASALLLAAAAGAAFMPAVHGQGDEPQRWDSEPFRKVVQLGGGAGQIGVSVRDVDNDDTKQPKSGVVVEEVRSGSAAEKAGVKDGDQIVEFDGERVRSVRQFTRLVQDTPIGRSVPVVVLRGGQRTTLNVAPTRGTGWRFDEDFGLISPPEPPKPPPAPDAPRPPKAVPPFPALPGFGFSYRSGGGRLGASVEDLSDELTEYFGVKHGVLVRSVTDGSPAAKAGLKAGDVITSVNGTTVEEPSDVSRTLDRLEDQAEFTIDVMRDKKPLTLKGKLGSRERSRSRAVV